MVNVASAKWREKLDKQLHPWHRKQQEKYSAPHSELPTKSYPFPCSIGHC